MKVPQYNPSPAGTAGGEGTYPKWGGGGGKKPQAGASWQDCKTAVVFRFPFSPSPLLWPSSFACPSPSIPGAAYSAKEFGERDGAASPRWEREQRPQPRLPSAWLPWGAPGNIAALGYPLMGGEVRQGCTKHCLPVLKGIAGVLSGLLLPLWPQRAPPGHPAQVSRGRCAGVDGT